MSRTFRIGRDYKKRTARDGRAWRGCGVRNCPWCKDNRRNVKIKSELKKALEFAVLFD
jgi:hypothetical protein